MTDVLERRFQAVANPHDDSSWDEVRRRAGRRPVPRLALLAAAAARGGRGGRARPRASTSRSSTSSQASRPPSESSRSTRVSTRRTAPGPAPKLRRDRRARRAASRPCTSRTATHTLYVAPTRDGGFCFMWTEMIGSCDRLGSMPLNVGWGGGPPVVSGHVDAEWVHSVEVRFVDGRVEKPKITWVSDPIGAGFFVHEVADIDDVVSVSALDEDGRVLTEQRFRHRQPLVAPQPEALVDEKQRVFGGRRRRRSADRLECAVEHRRPLRVVRVPRPNRPGSFVPRRGATTPDVVSAAVVQFAGARFLLGQAPPQATSVGGRLSRTAARPRCGRTRRVFIVPLAA